MPEMNAVNLQIGPRQNVVCRNAAFFPEDRTYQEPTTTGQMTKRSSKAVTPLKTESRGGRKKQQFKPSDEPEQVVLKYNLSPDYQHVRSSYRDTSKAVEKLRKEAQELREEIRMNKQILEKERLTKWGVDMKKKGKKKKASKKAQKLEP